MTSSVAGAVTSTIARARGDRALRTLVRNGAWVFGGESMGVGVGLAQGIVLSRALGLSAFGSLSVVMAFVTVLNRLTSFRMNEFVVQYVQGALVAKEPRRAAATMKLALLAEAGASVLAYVIVFAAATVGARLFVRLPDGPLLIRIFALTLLANLVTETAGGILQALGRFRLLSALRVAGRAATLGAVTVAWLAGGAMYELVWALVAGAAVSAALLTVSALRSARRDLGTSVWRAPLAELEERGEALRFMLSTNVSGMLSLLAKSDTDMLWLGFFCTPAQTGLYRIGMNLVTVVMAPVGPLGQATFPQIAHCAAAANWGQFRKLLRQTTTLVAALVVPAAVGMVLMGPWFLRTFYGPDFVPAARVMNIVVVGMAFASVLFWTRPALLALGLPGFQLRIAVWVAVLKVVGTLLVLPTFGYLGNAVLLTLLCFFAAGTTAARVHAVLKANERAARLA